MWSPATRCRSWPSRLCLRQGHRRNPEDYWPAPTANTWQAPVQHDKTQAVSDAQQMQTTRRNSRGRQTAKDAALCLVLDLRVRFEIPAGTHRITHLALRVLRHVFDIDLGEVYGKLIRGDQVVTTVPANLVTRDETVVQLDLQVLLLVAASLAAYQESLFKVLSGGAGKLQ